MGELDWNEKQLAKLERSNTMDTMENAEVMARMEKALRGVLHHNQAVKDKYKLPQSLIAQIEAALPKVEHILTIHSLHDAQASCSCGKWRMVGTGARTKEEIEHQFQMHKDFFFQ